MNTYRGTDIYGRSSKVTIEACFSSESTDDEPVYFYAIRSRRPIPANRLDQFAKIISKMLDDDAYIEWFFSNQEKRLKGEMNG